jgi:DNA-binding transcriptional ArsR family regulator
MPDLFEALAAPARRFILDELCDRDGQTLFELCGRLTMKHGMNLTRQAISQHLEALEAVGLIHSARQGRYKFHYLDTAPLKEIIERWLARAAKTAAAATPPSKSQRRPTGTQRGPREASASSPFSIAASKEPEHEDRRDKRPRR